MTEGVSWLPTSALADPRTADPVARVLREWSAAWLAAGSLQIPPRWEACETRDGPMGYTLASERDNHRLLLREDAKLNLAGLLLGQEIRERDCHGRCDRAVIEHLVEVAIAAFAEALDDVLEPGGGAFANDWFALPISLSGGMAVLRLEAARPVLVALAAEWAGPPRPASALPPRRTALAAQPLRLSARVGASRLALAEIEALGVGDVLTLDTPLAAPVGVCIDGKQIADAALTLAPEENCLKLQIERPPSQW